MYYQTIKKILKLASYVTFGYFSFLSLMDFIDGRVEYSIIQEKGENLLFPSVTLCPYDESSRVFFNSSQIQDDFNVSPSLFSGYQIWQWIKFQNKTFKYSLIKDYAYTEQEAKISSRLV